MKVLDPQSALLTNIEVHQFLQANTPRKVDKKVGAYPVVDLKDCARIRQDFETYVKNVTPYVGETPPVDTWMQNLVLQLKPFGLTQTEVMNLINLGVGLRNSSNTATTAADDDEDARREDEAGDENSAFPGNDEVLFKVVVEEHEERFPGDEGVQKIEKIINIIGNAIQVKTISNDKKT